MLSIQNQTGQYLQLAADTRLAIELVSTIFNTDDALPGSHSYPFRFPLSENNQQFVANNHRAEREIFPLLPVQVVAGSLHFRASMGFRVAGLYADAWLLVELGEVAAAIRKKNLRSFITEKWSLGGSLIQLIQQLKRLAEAPPAEYPVVFPPLRNDLMVEADFKPTEETTTYNKPTVFNRFNPVVGGYTVSALGADGEAGLVPCVYVAWLLRQVCRQLGYTARGTFFTDPDLIRLVLFNTQSMPGWNFDGGSYNVDIARHLPDMPIGDFFKAIRSWCGCGIFFDARSRTATFNTYRHMRLGQEPALDLSAAYIPNQDLIETPDHKGYLVNSFVEQSDELMAERTGYRKSFTVGQPDQEINLSVATLYMTRQPNYDHPNNLSWLIPHAKQAGNLADPFFETSNHYASYEPVEDPSQVPELKNRFGLCFLLYHGMQPDASGELYPYASSVSYNAKYQAVSGLSLMPGEPDDMFRRYQRLYYEWLANARSLTMPMLLPLSQLNALRLEKPVGLKTAHQVYAKYLVESLTYELPAQDGLVMAKLKVRQLIPVVLRHSTPDADLYNAVWVQLVYENDTLDEGFNFKTSYADLVLYFWEDGTFTTPATPPTILINYTAFSEEYQTDGSILKTSQEKTASASGHRFVVETQTILRQESRREDDLYYLDLLNYFTLQPGTSYRI